jgi:hypothetical protein
MSKDMAKERGGTDPHVYGTPDPDNPAPPAPGGLGDEKRGTKPGPDLEHVDHLADGDTVVVKESSGVVFAEKTGRSGLRRDGRE